MFFLSEMYLLIVHSFSQFYQILHHCPSNAKISSIFEVKAFPCHQNDDDSKDEVGQLKGIHYCFLCSISVLSSGQNKHHTQVSSLLLIVVQAERNAIRGLPKLQGLLRC